MNNKGFSYEKYSKLVTLSAYVCLAVIAFIIFGCDKLFYKLLYYYHDENVAFDISAVFLLAALAVVIIVAVSVVSIMENTMRVYFCRKITEGLVYSNIYNIYVTRNYVEFECGESQEPERICLPFDSYLVKVETKRDIEKPVFTVKDGVVTKLCLPEGHLWNEYDVCA